MLLTDINFNSTLASCYVAVNLISVMFCYVYFHRGHLFVNLRRGKNVIFVNFSIAGRIYQLVEFTVENCSNMKFFFMCLQYNPSVNK